MLKIGSFLVNEEQVQLVIYDPSLPQLSIYTSSQVTLFNGSDIGEAWNVLSAETGFVLVGKTQGQTLINSDLVELAFSAAGLFVFRVQGRDYMFADPGDFEFEFSKLAAVPAAAASVAVGIEPDEALEVS